MITKEFCEVLEYRISASFNNETDPQMRQLWCDGVTKPENEFYLKPEYIRENSKIELKAWFGKTGQEIYKLIVNLGKRSKPQILNSIEIIDCIPNITDDWIELDEENKILTIFLT